MFTLKEINIVKALIEDEMATIGPVDDCISLSLVARYRYTLSGIENKLEGLEKEMQEDYDFLLHMD